MRQNKPSKFSGHKNKVKVLLQSHHNMIQVFVASEKSHVHPKQHLNFMVINQGSGETDKKNAGGGS